MTPRWLVLLCCLIGLASTGCSDSIFIVDADFEIDAVEADNFGTILTKDEIADLNLTVQVDSDFIVIPTGIAIAFTTKASYVRVDEDKLDEFINATEWERRADYDETDPPLDEELQISAAGSSVVGVEIVNNQNEDDVRSRWVIWGIEEGTSSIRVEGSQSDGSHEVPVQVVFQ